MVNEPRCCKVDPEAGHHIHDLVILFGKWFLLEQLLPHGKEILKFIGVRNSVIRLFITEYRAEGRTSSVRKIVVINWRAEDLQMVPDCIVSSNVEPRICIKL